MGASTITSQSPLALAALCLSATSILKVANRLELHYSRSHTLLDEKLGDEVGFGCIPALSMSYPANTVLQS